LHIAQRVARRGQDYHGNVERRQMLLVLEFSSDRQEDIEFILGET
jgi:hypothetical protein